MKTGTISLLTAAALAVLGINPALEAAEGEKGISVEVNGNRIPQQAIVDSSQQSVLLPLRSVAESLGFQVSWNAERKVAEVRKEGITGQVALGKEEQADALLNQTGEAKPRLLMGITYVPVAFVEEVMQADVAVTEDSIRVTEEEETAPPVTGTVTKINRHENGRLSILLNGYETGIILYIDEDTRIEKMDGQRLKAEDLQMGMEVEATHPPFMALSMPPQAGAIRIVVKSSLEEPGILGTAGRVASVERIQDGIARIRMEGEALNEGAPQQVLLVVDENTEIVNARDQKRLKAEDLRVDMKVYAFYGPMMAESFPPRAAAEKIVVEIPASP